MTRKRIIGCLRVTPGVRVPPVEYHCSTVKYFKYVVTQKFLNIFPVLKHIETESLIKIFFRLFKRIVYNKLEIMFINTIHLF
jgi:hypothetical protein